MLPPIRDSKCVSLFCSSCGTALMVPVAKVGISGPCPKCGHWIDSSTINPQSLPAEAEAPKEDLSNRRNRMQAVTAGRGRVRADGYLDHEYNERKELYGTLRVLAVGLAVMAVILFITLYLRQWMRG